MKHVEQDRQEQAAAAWHRKAQYEDRRCSVCGDVISYDDREQAFSSKMCSYHADKARKDD